MLLMGKVLTATSQTVMTKAGNQLDKTRMKLLDVDSDDGAIYWVDFLGESAIPQGALDEIRHQEVEIEIRSIRATVSNGKAYLNITGGIARHAGEVLQPTLKVMAKK